MDNPGSESSVLDMHTGAEAFASLLGDQPSEQSETEQETPEAAAERLAAEEAGANQQNAENGEKQQADAEPEEAITFEVDGKTVKLSKAELAEQYKNGLRQQDYTRKTMETAEVRKAAEAEQQKARAERDTYAQQLNNFVVTASSLQQEADKVLTQELLQADPVEYLSQKRIFEQRQADLAKAAGELQRIQAEYQQEQQQEHQTFLRNQFEKLLENRPDWKDPAKLKEGVAKLESFMAERGFGANDGRVLLDARFMLMADDAMKYQQLMARAKDAASKVKAAPAKVERPGVTQNVQADPHKEAMKRLAKTGSLRDGAAAMMGFV